MQLYKITRLKLKIIYEKIKASLGVVGTASQTQLFVLGVELIVEAATLLKPLSSETNDSVGSLSKFLVLDILFCQIVHIQMQHFLPLRMPMVRLLMSMSVGVTHIKVTFILCIYKMLMIFSWFYVKSLNLSMKSTRMQSYWYSFVNVLPYTMMTAKPPAKKNKMKKPNPMLIAVCSLCTKLDTKNALQVKANCFKKF